MQRGLSTITQISLPIKTSFRLSKLLRFCNEEMRNVEKSREELVKRMAIENPEKPGELQVTPENEEKFRQEFATLLQEEVDFDFTPINLSDFGDDIKITPMELASLSKIINEDG